MKFQARLFVLMFFGLLTSAPLFSQSDPFQNVGDDPFGGDEESTKRFIRMEGIKINVPGAELVQIISDGGSIRNIEIGPQQRKKIEGLQKKYLGELKELLGDEHVSEKLEWARLRNLEWSLFPKGTRGKLDLLKTRCKKEFLAVLLPIQLEKLDNMGLIAGIPRIVTESAMSEMLDLSDEQKRKIKIESNKLAKEIEDFAHKTRKRAAEISLMHLTEKQRKQLYAIYGKPQINRALSMNQLRWIFRQHLFTADPPKGSKDLAKGKNVEWTPLNLDQIVKKTNR